jgi:hypothetical protein
MQKQQKNEPLAEVPPNTTPIAMRTVADLRRIVRKEIDEALRIAENRWAEGDLSGAIFRVGRNEAPGFLDQLWIRGAVTVEQLRVVLLDVWSGAEFPCRLLPRKIWLEWFAAAGFLSGAGQPAPTQPVEVWRSQVGRQLGLSWTRDHKIAVWFQERNQSRGLASRLLHGFARPASVLAFCDKGRAESEVIVHPRGIPRHLGGEEFGDEPELRERAEKVGA